MITKISTSEAVVNYFKEQIMSGTLKPGDKLPSERILQKELGISRFALREGLVRLSALGIITITQGKGSFINEDAGTVALSDIFLPLFLDENPNYLDDLLFARNVLERENVSAACSLRSEDDLVVLEDILRAAGDISSDSRLFGEADFLFHSEIARIGGNIFLQKMHELLADQIKNFLIDLSQCPEVHEIILREHYMILDAIRYKDSEKAQLLMVEHLKQCKNSYGRQLRKRVKKTH